MKRQSSFRPAPIGLQLHLILVSQMGGSCRKHQISKLLYKIFGDFSWSFYVLGFFCNFYVWGFLWVFSRIAIVSRLIEKIRGFRSFIWVRFSKLVVESEWVEKKSAISGNKISKLRVFEFAFENRPLKSVCNGVIFSITVITLQRIGKSVEVVI